jgi:hypothetical protein
MLAVRRMTPTDSLRLFWLSGWDLLLLAAAVVLGVVDLGAGAGCEVLENPHIRPRSARS